MENENCLKLRIMNGHQAQQSFELNSCSSLGSASSSKLRILSPLVSALHARIEPSLDGRWRLRHLSREFTTLINGVEVGEAPLSPGDIIQIGQINIEVLGEDKDKVHDVLISKNPIWQEHLQQLPSIALAQYPVLLLGPSGSGKDFLANQIHQLSPRHKQAFISVNCAAISENLVESELFGHKKGSFTGAINDRQGAFEAANMGTLFLDEIGDMPLAAQAKLLRALENNEVKAIGSDKAVPVDVRVIAATHKDLFELCEQKLFRSDLLYRLNVIRFDVPGLAERSEDIPDFIHYFSKKNRVQLSETAEKFLCSHPWIGNIREMKNFFARAKSLFPGLLITEDRIPLLLDTTKEKTQVKQHSNTGLQFLKDLEKEMILEKLKLNGWNQRLTAIELGMPKSTLNDRLKKYGFKKPAKSLASDS